MFWFALYIEAVNDDRYYYEKYDDYKEYFRKVPNRFFDFSFITGKKVKKVQIEDEQKDKKEEKKEEPVKKRRNKKKQD